MASVLWEGMDRGGTADCFVGVTLRNNQFAVTSIIPDRPWLDPEVRSSVESELPNCGKNKTQKRTRRDAP